MTSKEGEGCSQAHEVTERSPSSARAGRKETGDATRENREVSIVRRFYIAIAVLALAASALACGESGQPAEDQPAGDIMYFCGYDRCKDSGEYGNLIFETGINVWNNPGPDRGGVHHRANHHERVSVVDQKRVNDGPGGLWYKLADGGWTNDLWLTEEKCTRGNLEEYSFTDCMMGEY